MTAKDQAQEEGSGGGVQTSAYIVFGIGLVFFLTRQINLELFWFIGYDDLLQAVYLPSGVRILAVLLFGSLGVAGIVLGWILCHLLAGERTFFECFYLGVLFGGTAYLSLQVWQWYFQIDDSYSALSARLLISLVLVSAVITAMARFILIFLSDTEASFLSVFSIGFVGDTIGAFLVLYLFKLGLFLRRTG
jgi:hypothetical protein